MHTITLYRIQCGAKPHVSQAYRMYTQRDMQIPSTLELYGVHIDKAHKHWYQANIASVLGDHNGDSMIDLWCDEGDQWTIALSLDDVILMPDLLMNLTSLQDSPHRHVLLLNTIKDTIETFEKKQMKVPSVSQTWYKEEEQRWKDYNEQVSALLKQLRM